MLEGFHAFKVRGYVDPANETRRLMWTLGHAHGTLLALLNLTYGLWLMAAPQSMVHRRRLISRCLIAATVVLPGGFLLAGIAFYSGDPGVGGVLIPVGAALLLAALFLLTRVSWRQ